LAILKVHARNKKMAASVDLMTIARGTNGMTGADLENILNEAALLAGRQDKKEIETADIEAAKEKVLVGKKRSVKIIEEEKKVIAVHESGHALVHLACSRFDALHKVSIVPRGGALGLTWSLPVEDRHLLSRKQADDMILSILGGRAAEELLLGRDNITSGASNDLERATALLRQMVAHYGMDEEFGLAAFGDSSANPFLGREMALHSGMSQGMQEKIEKRVCVLLGDYYKKTKQILEEKSAELEKLSAALMERETLSADEVKELLATNK
jgi:cell division protease FtsH